MKMYQYRNIGQSRYFKLAVWDARSFTFRDGKVAYATAEDARKAAKKSGKYRISCVYTDTGAREDYAPFDV